MRRGTKGAECHPVAHTSQDRPPRCKRLRSGHTFSSRRPLNPLLNLLIQCVRL
jgi:hypothetical protein